MELEEKYGDGHYSDRRLILDIDLSILEADGRADPRAAYEVLVRARMEAAVGYRSGKLIDHARLLSNRRKKAVRSLEKGIQEMQEFLRWITGDLFHEMEAFDLSRCLRDLLKAMESDPLLNAEFGPRLRRLSAGHQPEPWLRKCRQSLTSARFPSQIRDDLLIAIGLIP